MKTNLPLYAFSEQVYPILLEKDAPDGASNALAKVLLGRYYRNFSPNYFECRLRFILFFIVKDAPDGASNAGPVASHHVAAVSLRGQPANRESCTHC